MTMEQYPVQTINRRNIKNKSLTVKVPGSKSMTNRALLLATLADGTSTLRGVLFSDDSRYFMECVKELGFFVVIDEERRMVTLTGEPHQIPKQEASLYVGSAGTAARFLTALLGISKGDYLLDASQQMRRRPMAPLLLGLKQLGAEITYLGEENHFPFRISGRGVSAREITVNIDDSSQFLSALLISCCRTDGDFTIHVTGRHGMAYIDMTTRMMEEFGVRAIKRDVGGQMDYFVPAGQSYHARDYRIEPDVSAACYFYAMAMLLGICMTVAHVHETTLQGDIAFVKLLCEMGAHMEETPEGIALTGPADGHFSGVAVDMHAFSDQALTLAALAPFADTPTTITGIGHLRGQECDRIAAMKHELTGLGVCCEEFEDGIRIFPAWRAEDDMQREDDMQKNSGMAGNFGTAGDSGKSTLHGGIVQTYDDHRVAMSFALIGLRVPGIVIDNPGCCAKTFENYFEVLTDACHRLR